MLHHYTTVNTLALILKYQTLRFTRLDQFDDVTEGRSLGPFPFGARMFASCWSVPDEEIIPQWVMYGDAMRGVRLSLRKDPFVWHSIDIKWHKNFQFHNLEAPFCLKEMLAPNITLVPTVLMRSNFGQSVKYLPDVTAELKKLILFSEPDKVSLLGEGTEIAFLKSNYWEFQQEYRYVLTAHPGPPEPFLGDPSAYIESRRSWQKKGANFLTDVPVCRYIDLKLDQNALSCAKIIIGPLAPPGTLEIVESLVARYAAGAKVEMSSLSGTMRAK